jgi:2-aminoadipate transaminase
MVSAIRKHFPAEVRWQEPRGGLYVWAQLPSRVKSGVKSKLFETALAREVLYVPANFAMPTTHPAQTESRMRISFGGARDREIPLGIERLGAVMRS